MSWSPRRSRVWGVAVALALASGALKWWVVETALRPAPAAPPGQATVDPPPPASTSASRPSVRPSPASGSAALMPAQAA